MGLTTSCTVSSRSGLKDAILGRSMQKPKRVSQHTWWNVFSGERSAVRGTRVVSPLARASMGMIVPIVRSQSRSGGNPDCAAWLERVLDRVRD